MKVSGLLAYEGIQVRGIGLLTSNEAYIFYAGLVLVLIFRYFKIRGAVLFSIIGAAIIAHLLGVGQPIEPIEYLQNTIALPTNSFEKNTYITFLA